MPSDDEKPTPRRVNRRRRAKPAVTNVNIFALGSENGAQAKTYEPREETPAHDGLEEPLVSAKWLEGRSRRLDALEQDLRARALELERREAELEQQEAEFEAEAFIRSEAFEERERRLTDLEQRLDQRESELSSYVARVQSGFLRDAV
jgi:hypothetical protein